MEEIVFRAMEGGLVMDRECDRNEPKYTSSPIHHIRELCSTQRVALKLKLKSMMKSLTLKIATSVRLQ